MNKLVILLSTLLLVVVGCEFGKPFNNSPASSDGTSQDDTEPVEPIDPVITCPVPQASERLAQINRIDPNGPNFIEISGVAFSQTQSWNGHAVIWVHNDSGSGRRFAAYDVETGERIKSYRLDAPGVGSSDWEDIAIGPCVDQPGDCLYVGDIGNNAARDSGGATGRDAIYIYKFKEPNVNDGGQADNFQITTGVTVLQMDYRGADGISGPRLYADSEALFVDPLGDSKGGRAGDIYLVTKWNGGSNDLARLVKYPYADQQHNVRFHLVAVSDQIPTSPITRGDISGDGSFIALGTYGSVFTWLRSPDMTIAESIAQDRCSPDIPLPSPRLSTEVQFEALAISPDNSALLQISECNGASQCDIPINITDFGF